MTSVLVADDHHFFRAGVSAMLKAAGIEVVCHAGDGDDALSGIARTNPDIVILDIRMPKRNGVETLKALRERGDTRPVIVMATELKDEQLVAVMRSGANAIVFKDGPEGDLLQAIENVLQGKSFIDSALLEKAFHLTSRTPGPSHLDVLSERERQVAQCVGEGMRNREIGEKLGMTEGTVKTFLHSIYTKSGISNRTELALMFHRNEAQVSLL